MSSDSCGPAKDIFLTELVLPTMMLPFGPTKNWKWTPW